MSNEFEQPVEPMSRTEDLLRTGTEEPVIAMSEIEKILRGEHIDRPHSRVADLLLQYNPSDILIEKSITENGTYYASADGADGYYKVVVDTPVIRPTVLEHLVETISTNGTHTFTPGTGVDGYSDATINVNVPAPELVSRNATVNGTINKDADGVNGYSQIVVDVKTPAVNHDSLEVTENGTYYPPSNTTYIFTVPTIDDDVETGIYLGSITMSRDQITIGYTNKTTSATGTKTIYPPNIATHAIPQSKKDKTLLEYTDANHYIYITTYMDSIFILQKGFTITDISATDNDNYFDEVTVNVPTGPDIDYLYDWDFTQSLTDKIEEQTAVLSGATRDSEGLHFITKKDSCLLLSDINMVGKTIEVDISHMDSKEVNKCVITQSQDTSSSSNKSSPLKYITRNKWAADGRSNQVHTSNTTVNYNPTPLDNAFNGKTAKIVYFPDCTLLYIDDEFIGLQDMCNPALFRETYMSCLYLGNSGDFYGVGFYNMTITGCRIYNNILGEKTITENGTYYAPDDNVDGYLKVNANIPLGTKSITANGTYTASSDSLAGYSQVTVNVPPVGTVIPTIKLESTITITTEVV